MMKKAIWIVLSCLMVLSLAMVSCSGTPEEEEEEEIQEEETGSAEEEEEEEEEEITSPDAPAYGGTLTVVATSDPRGFDDVYGWNAQNFTLKMTHEELTTGDWSRGPAGTGEYDWAIESIIRMDTKVGALAESWEIPAEGTIVFNIRQGVHFALDSDNEASCLAAGREITAEDIASMLTHMITTPGHPFENAGEECDDNHPGRVDGTRPNCR
jgi:ABC-type transport system substrate-binding protein